MPFIGAMMLQRTNITNDTQTNKNKSKPIAANVFKCICLSKCISFSQQIYTSVFEAG